jgi:hypothetical protein
MAEIRTHFVDAEMEACCRICHALARDRVQVRADFDEIVRRGLVEA